MALLRIRARFNTLKKYQHEETDPMLQLYRLKEQGPERVEYPSSSYSSASRIYQNIKRDIKTITYARVRVIRDSIIAWAFNVAIATC